MRAHLGLLLETVDRVKALCADSDSLGLAFNALLRGKWEAGEGLGTHLTPEEVVRAMVSIAFRSLPWPDATRSGADARSRADDGALLGSLSDEARACGPSLLFGDPCGGTGRFLVAIASELGRAGYDPHRISQVTRLYDQSSLSVDFAKLSFALLIATNPPFGSGKYAWSMALEQAVGPGILRALGAGRLGDTFDPAIQRSSSSSAASTC